MTTPAGDPFGTADLREAVLRTWASSPSRFREDANAEELLSLGYGGRVLAELAANGADAARAAGVPAELRITWQPPGPDGSPAELRVANTGAPLTAEGVAALAALRASAKRDDDGVGHFGVGFTAVRALSDDPAIVSTTGGVRFSVRDTVTAVDALHVPALDEELRRRRHRIPALRLPWPMPPDPGTAAPPPGFSTEVRLPLRADVDANALADRLTVDLAVDLLWALPGLDVIALPDHCVRRGNAPDGISIVSVEPAPAGTADGAATAPERRAEHHRFRTAEASGLLPEALLADRPVEEQGRRRWHLAWVLPVTRDGRPRPVGRSVVGAPTPTDEPLSLPARLVGTFPVDENRSRIAAGPLTEHLVRAAADAYLDLVQALPGGWRASLVPAGGFPVGDLDAALRQAISDRLAGAAFLIDAGGTPVPPSRACLVAGLSGRAAAAVVQAMPGLLDWPPAAGDVERLRGIGVAVRAVPEVTAALAALDRPADFWSVVYDALAEAPAEELADLPVPRRGGGTMIGPRGVLIPAVDVPEEPVGRGVVGADLADRAGGMLPGLRLAALDHPLLRRLGAESADTESILRSAALADEMRRRRDDLDYADPDPDDAADFAALVLGLVAIAATPDPAMTADLVLTDSDGEPWPAGELVLPDAPLRGIVAADADLAEVGRSWVSTWGVDVLSRAGVRSGFGVRRYDAPPAAEADLADVHEWWDRIGGDPDAPTFVAVPDLDLVDPDSWPAALTLLAGDRTTRDALRPSASGPSYTGWWLARHARIGGLPLGRWRTAAATELAGLYDVLPVALPTDVAADIGVLRTIDQAAADPAELLRRWADPDRRVCAQRVPALTAALVGALTDSPGIDLTDGVRTLAGEVVDADSAAVLDDPWLAQAVDPAGLVPGGADPHLVAEVLDLALASERFRFTVVAAAGDTDSAPLGEVEAGARCLRRCGREDLAARVVHLIPELAVTGPRAAGPADSAAARPEPAARRVWWWVDGDRVLLDGSPDAVGRAVAWLTGRWPDRHALVAVARGDRVDLAEWGVA